MTNLAISWSNFPAASLSGDQSLMHAWDNLNAARERLLFLDARVISIALDVFGNNNERLLVGRKSGRIVCMLILVPQGKFRWISFQPSQIPLGAWVADAGLSPLEITRSLCRGPLGLCLSVSLTQMDPLLTVREADESDSETADYIETGWIDIAGSFDEYWAARGKNLRQNMKKQRNKLQAEGLETRMLTLTAQEDMAAVIERYGSLESIGWKSGRGTAIHHDNDQGRFYRAILEYAATANEAIVFEYYFGDRLVAMNLCLLRDGILVILKTTYDESVPSAFSPAFLLQQDELIQFFGEGKIIRVEYYGRLMDWHTKWTDKKRTLFHLTTFRFSAIKRLAQWRRSRVLTDAPEKVAVKNDAEE